MGVKELYELDFFEWTQRNAELLRRGCLESADIPHIAEELADMGERDRREVRSYLRRLMMHLMQLLISGVYTAGRDTSLHARRCELQSAAR
jgi:hypothetical protein